MTTPIQVKVSDVPDDANIDFRDSTYFKSWNELPSPADVRAAAATQAKISTEPNRNPPPVLFREKRLWVKWGTRFWRSEAQSLYVVHKFLGDVFPAPEIYGWRIDNHETFIYYQYLEGQNLEEAWDSIKTEDRLAISYELQQALTHLRRLRQEPEQQFIGAPTRSPLYDRFLESLTSQVGPFQSVEAFHDWFALFYRTRLPGSMLMPIEPFRFQLPDDTPIRFTHSDLHPRNIIVTMSEPHKLVGIIDYEQSGWLPEYWEELKARGSAGLKGYWPETCLSIALPRAPPEVVDAYEWYLMSIGP